MASLEKGWHPLRGDGTPIYNASIAIGNQIRVSSASSKADPSLTKLVCLLLSIIHE